MKYRGKKNERVWREQVQMLRNPWVLPGLATKKGYKALHGIRQRLEYQTPEFGDENHTTETSQPKLDSPSSAAENLRRILEEQQNRSRKPRLPEPTDNDGQNDQGGADD